MDDISQLIKEAKPLYFARKRRNNCIKATLAMLVCTAMIGLFVPKTHAPFEYQDYWYSIISTTEQGSVIADMGLPTDEFGLLDVA